MAKLLPDTFYFDRRGEVYWQKQPEFPSRVGRVINTEWLYVMHLVEQTLDMTGDLDEPPELRQSEFSMYINYLSSGAVTEGEVVCATFNQRATAMCKVKGIEL